MFTAINYLSSFDIDAKRVYFVKRTNRIKSIAYNYAVNIEQ
jgi:hypothetical protein